MYVKTSLHPIGTFLCVLFSPSSHTGPSIRLLGLPTFLFLLPKTGSPLRAWYVCSSSFFFCLFLWLSDYKAGSVLIVHCSSRLAWSWLAPAVIPYSLPCKKLHFLAGVSLLFQVFFVRIGWIRSLHAAWFVHRRESQEIRLFLGQEGQHSLLSRHRHRFVCHFCALLIAEIHVEWSGPGMYCVCFATRFHSIS